MDDANFRIGYILRETPLLYDDMTILFVVFGNELSNFEPILSRLKTELQGTLRENSKLFHGIWQYGQPQ
jgi:hypothetical protein